MKSRVVLGVALLASAAGCGDMVGPSNVAVPAHALLVSIAVPGRCIVGGCDPISTELNRLGLVTLANTGSAKVFIRLCGGAPAIGEQQFVNGQWINVGPAITCAVGPTSKAIAPNDSVQINMWFGVGTWRLNLGVAADTALATEALSVSAPVLVN